MEDLPAWFKDAWIDEREENSAFRLQTGRRLDEIADWILTEETKRSVRKETKDSREAKLKTLLAIFGTIAGAAGVVRGFLMR
jgi:hypothetical protein